MITLSAAQAISPAIERTKQFLFQPFRLGRFLKLTLVALLAEGGMSSCNFNWHVPSRIPGGSDHPFHPIPPMHLPQTSWPAMVVVLVVVAIIAIIVIPLMILIGYLLIRLRFSFFDCVLYQQDRIAPAWRRYHRQAMRYLGLTICVSLAFWAVILAAGLAIYEHFKPLFQSIGSSHGPGFVDFLPIISLALLLVLVLGLIGVFVHTALSYFVLPHMALEDASIRDALTDVWGDIEAEPWQYLFFLLLRFLVTLAATIIGIMALVIPFVILGGIGAVIFLILKAFSAGVAVLLAIPAAILLGALFLLALIGVSGTIGTFRRNYALLFYGGRYPPLGAILAPPLPPPAPVWAPAPAPAAPGSTEGV
jgi:hypothetical protein